MMISTIRNNLLLEVTGCPIPRIEKAIIDATRQFCEDSRALKKTMTVNGSFAASRGGDYYIITTNLIQYNSWENTDPIDPMECQIDGTDYTLFHMDPGDELTDLTMYGDTKYYFFSDQHTLKIFPFESTDSDVEVVLTVALKPSEGAEYIEDQLYLRYQRAIEQKTLFILKSISGSVWTDIEMAMVHSQEYLNELGQARIKVKTGGFPVRQIAKGGYF